VFRRLPPRGGGAEDSGVLELNVYNAEEYISEFDAEWETFDIIKKFEGSCHRKIRKESQGKLLHFRHDRKYV